MGGLGLGLELLYGSVFKAQRLLLDIEALGFMLKGLHLRCSLEKCQDLHECSTVAIHSGACVSGVKVGDSEAKPNRTELPKQPRTGL